MATKLHLLLDELDSSRTFMSPQQHPIGVRRYIASKANLDVQDVINLEIYGLDGCKPHIANRIFDALAETQRMPINNQEKCRLLSKGGMESEIANRAEKHRIESDRYRIVRDNIK